MGLNNEVLLLKNDLRKLISNRRIGRTALAFGVLGLIVNKLLIYLFIISVLGNTQELLDIILVVAQVIHFLCVIFIVTGRLRDIGASLWYLFILGGSYFFILIGGGALSINSVCNSIIYHAYYPLEKILTYHFIVLCFALSRSTPARNKYGIDEGRDIIDNDQVIAYGHTTDKFYIGKDIITDLCENIWNTLFIRIVNIKGRTARRDFLLSIIGTQLFISLIMYLIIGVISLLFDMGIKIYIPQWGLMILYVWPFIGLSTLIIRRLHDSLLSGFWILGLLIPYVNIYVIYHLLFKGSWHLDS